MPGLYRPIDLLLHLNEIVVRVAANPEPASPSGTHFLWRSASPSKQSDHFFFSV